MNVHAVNKSTMVNELIQETAPDAAVENASPTTTATTSVITTVAPAVNPIALAKGSDHFHPAVEGTLGRKLGMYQTSWSPAVATEYGPVTDCIGVVVGPAREYTRKDNSGTFVKVPVAIVNNDGSKYGIPGFGRIEIIEAFVAGKTRTPVGDKVRVELNGASNRFTILPPQTTVGSLGLSSLFAGVQIQTRTTPSVQFEPEEE